MSVGRICTRVTHTATTDEPVRQGAKRMAEHGAKVVISSRKQDVCDAVSKEINDKFGKDTSIAIAANISSKENLQNLVNESNRAFGKIDVLVCNTRAIVPGAVMSCRPVGVLVMKDDAGPDEKIIAVPTSKLTRRYENIKSYSDLPEITIQQIEHFFQHYKDLEPDKWVEITSVEQVDVAKRMIMEAIERDKTAP